MKPCPCPFCGEDTSEVRLVFSDYFVWCKSCQATGPKHKVENGAVLAWNNQHMVNMIELLKFMSERQEWRRILLECHRLLKRYERV